MRRRPRQKRPSSSRRTRPCASSATASRWAVGRLSPVAADQLGQRARLGLDGGQHGHRLVEHADAAYTVHEFEIIVSECETVKREPWPQTLSEKVWDRHVVRERTRRARPALHRPPPRPRGHQPAGLRRHPPGRPHACAGPTSRSPPRTTTSRPRTSTSRSPTRSRPSSSRCCAANTAEFGITHYGMGDPNQGIVHVIGPEQGRTLPGMTIVCGDSHTSTHGAFGALAFGIGTSEVEHVLATQTLPQQRPGTMAVTVDGELPGRRHRQGRDPRHHRPHRHRRRHRLGHRVPRRHDRRRSRWRAA